jgi:predicted O-methyltransferase YrrM
MVPAMVMLLLLVVCLPDTRANELDMRVQLFLQQHRGSWHDLNVPAADGQLLHDLVVQHGFTRALEIGTSTGHSTIWIAWGLSKTGGKLTTIEIDEQRYRQARKNVAAAGLSRYVDFVLGDAHELVPTLPGPYDFVFSDADKSWYRKYFEAIYPKLTQNACFTAHNVSSRWMAGIKEFLDYAYSRADMETTINKGSPAGVSITCKK